MINATVAYRRLQRILGTILDAERLSQTFNG